MVNPLRLLVSIALFAIAFAHGEPNYVGSAVCKTCHPNVWANFYKNPHYQTLALGKPAPQSGCESCHGPASDHVAAKGDKTKIVAFSVLAPEKVLDNCLACHANTLGRANIRRSSHTTARVACNSCHSIHRASQPKYLLAKPQTALCFDCHQNVRAQFSLPFKHRVIEGFMQCSDCHNPHGAAAPTWSMGVRPRMVDTALGNEQPCMKCHVDKRGPFAFEHPAVRVDGCESCHAPHGSANARLLRRPQVFPLCLECHSGGAADSGFGRQGDGIRPQSASHNMADPRYRNCTTCHVRIHGSNADRRFLR